jgi:hypothetical protein
MVAVAVIEGVGRVSNTIVTDPVSDRMDAGRRVGFQEFARLPIGDFMRENRALADGLFSLPFPAEPD